MAEIRCPKGLASRRGTAMLLLTAGDPEISGALADGILAVRGTTGDIICRYETSAAAGTSSVWPDGQPPSPKRSKSRREASPLGFRAEGKALTLEQIEVVSAEIDRQKIMDWQNVAHQLRVAMHREPVDYAKLAWDAEVAYGESLYAPGVLGKIGEAMLVGYAMVVLAFERLFEEIGIRD